MHPIWIMEGLCSLPEDLETLPSGELVKPIPSWRTNQGASPGKERHAHPMGAAVKLDHKQFIGSPPLAYYAQARCIFLYLYSRGKLKEWYQAYVDGFAEDSTGAKALEKVLGKPLKDIQKDYAAWLRLLPEVQEEFKPGDAVFPFDFEDGSGDGIVVASMVSIKARGARPRPRRAASASMTSSPLSTANRSANSPNSSRCLASMSPAPRLKWNPARQDDRYCEAGAGGVQVVIRATDCGFAQSVCLGLACATHRPLEQEWSFRKDGIRRVQLFTPKALSLVAGGEASLRHPRIPTPRGLDPEGVILALRSAKLQCFAVIWEQPFRLQTRCENASRGCRRKASSTPRLLTITPSA